MSIRQWIKENALDFVVAVILAALMTVGVMTVWPTDCPPCPPCPQVQEVRR